MIKPVVGWESVYMITDRGQVIRILRGKSTHPGREMKQQQHHNKRMTVTLRHNGRKETQYVHCMVTHAFLGLPPSNHETNHINGDPTDNRLSNLEYVTRSQNLKHSFALGLHPSNQGEGNPSHTLTIADVQAIRQSTEPGVEMARRFNVGKSTVSDIRLGKTWH